MFTIPGGLRGLAPGSDPLVSSSPEPKKRNHTALNKTVILQHITKDKTWWFTYH